MISDDPVSWKFWVHYLVVLNLLEREQTPNVNLDITIIDTKATTTSKVKMSVDCKTDSTYIMITINSNLYHKVQI